MLGKTADQNQYNLFNPLLKEFIDPSHELVKLAEAIGWKSLENTFAPLYSSTGRPAKPVRLMAGLLIIKHMYNLSDETLVGAFVSNPYYQHFCGAATFQWCPPCDASDLVHFRKRLGPEGIEQFFKLSINLFSHEVKQAQRLLVDTTVQEKNITYPTDNKLQTKIIKKCWKIAKEEGIILRQSYSRTVKKLQVQLRFSHHPKRKKQASKAARRLKTIAGRLSRELRSKLRADRVLFYEEGLSTFSKVLDQKPQSKNKVYSLHEPSVSCIAKGKRHKPYEFGNKIAIATLPGSNLIVGIGSFNGNPHDSTTLCTTLMQVERMTQKHFKYVVADRGYTGAKGLGKVNLVTPNPIKDKTLSRYQRDKKRKLCCSRAAIEPIIGHMKSSYRMGKNYLKELAET